ncbi:LysE family translocator [Paenibacillus sp. R14(2021)]|uniref:LysE family translocator n=1 Tax=Paenibacillus sp. R14(2021) TaxID=2859228 RepID=UPI001C611A36|nr:LysE family transporter [Paenibacillus sp. R14(2021)]
MMMLAKGMIIGLSVAAPVGPIGILCMKRTINQGRRFGFAAGLGAATADGLYGCIAALGFDRLTAGLVSMQSWISLLGGLFLCCLGIQAFRSSGDRDEEAGMSRSIAGAYLTTFLLTITNPITILSFIGIFAGLDVLGASSSQLFVLVLGVIAGSALWWLLLSFVVGFIKQILSAGAMRLVNRMSGLILLGFGIYSLSKGFLH